MTPTTRLKRQLILFVFSILHFITGIYVYKDTLILVVLGMIFVILNVGLLLHHFSINLRFIFAYRVKKPFLKVPQNIVLLIFGVLGYAILIYLFFLMIFTFLVQIIGFLQ